MKKILLSIALLSFLFNSFSQELWQETSKKILNNKELVRRNNFPKQASYYKLDVQYLKNILKTAPERNAINLKDLIISFPMANGKFEKFKVFHSPIMHPDLSAKYPMIKTYVAQGIDDPTAYMRFSVTQFGLHTMCLSGNRSSNFIDPYTSDRKYYIVYNKNSLGKNTQQYECLMNDNLSTQKSLLPNPAPAVNDQKFRKYRLALSCTAEYGNIFGTNLGTEKADIQAQMAISINRVNTVYEIDFAIQLEFIANNDTLIYFGNTSADPWSGNSNTLNAQVIDNAIGVDNYDVGHHFSTSSGGNAGCLSCVCLDYNQAGTHKGRAYTGRANPTGDAFDIDYVAHELGHQFGGWHTMNTCSRSGSGQTEVEPASGSSIMGYAGICNTNVQAHSDDHFNYVNIRDISANTQPGGDSDCALEIPSSNLPPTADAGADYVIPKSTAFVLEGIASDPNGLASLTYNWSQNDPEQAPTNGSPQTTWVNGPLYRSISPTTSPNRYLPNIASVIAGNLTPTWEVTPSVSRTMEFAFMVRDNDVLGAQTADDLMTVTVDGSAGPFKVTSPASPQNWQTGQSQTITWNVAGTNSGAVNTPNVDIFFSTDGGYTYPISLLTNTPNDGTQVVSIPSSAVTTNGKIMVRGANNIFYALNNSVITVTPGDVTLDFISTTINSCSLSDVTYSFVQTNLNGFSENMVYSITNLPSGINATFTPMSSTSSVNGQVVLSNISAGNVGLHNLIFHANSSSVSLNIPLVLEVGVEPNAPTLSFPLDNSIGVLTTTSLNWNAVLGAGVTYDLEISTDNSFLTTIESVTGLNSNTYTSSLLQENTTYYWRVKATNSCGSSAFSSIFQFETNSCEMVNSLDVPIVIPNFGSPTITSIINIATSDQIIDVNVYNLIGDHSYLGDLTITLTSPSGTDVVLIDGICGGNNDFDLNFDDDAINNYTSIPCPAIGGGTFQALGSLADFNGENSAGDWVLTIEDNYNNDGGSLNSWSLEVCTGVIPCISSDIPLISVSDENTCPGQVSVLSIASGNLNDAVNWAWYSDSCTGSFLGSGNSLNVFPMSTTSYFVKGEGGCVSNATCGNTMVNVFEQNNIVTDITENDSALINGNWYFSSQLIEDHYVSVDGCDSIAKTNLTIKETITETPNAIRKVIESDFLKIFPNPSNGKVFVSLDKSLLKNSKSSLMIFDILGQEIYKEISLQEEKLIINLEKHSKGVYHLFFQNEKIIIQRDLILF